MKKTCNTCTYKSEIANSQRITCHYYWENKHLLYTSPASLSDISDYAKTSGWFDFPYDFDPLWITTDCNGYKREIDEPILYTNEF